MGRINVLEKHVAELIAAGEVVERPSSVIKELVENAIDAGATTITVEIKNGGTTFMRVTDNGHGIMREDIRNAFLRHATSKVANENDLDSISTLGFRGEALASVSAVAKVELITCSDNEEVGSCYVIEGGDEISFNDAGCPVGTTIIVRDLFYNIPARQKFLKKDVAEGNAVSLVIDRIALSHPEISFTFIRDSKQTLKTAGDSQLRSAIYAVYGRDFSSSLIEVDYELEGISVKGYISQPINARPNRNMQTFFVNNRYVKSRTAGAAVDEAAKGSVMVGKFLSCVLNISMSFNAVDVNVHPAKIEVRFVNERPLFNAVYHAVKSALIKGDKRKEALFNTPARNASENPFAQFDLRSKAESKKEDTKAPAAAAVQKAQPVSYVPDAVSNPSSASKPKITPLFNRNISVSDSKSVDDYLKGLNIIKETQEEASFATPQIIENTSIIETTTEESKKIEDTVEITEEISTGPNTKMNITEPQEPVSLFKNENTEPEFKFIGEAFRTYIIIEFDKELIFIDKHALHERIIYEKLKENAENFSQLLLVPKTIVLDKTIYASVIENLDMFKDCGFDVEDFGFPTLLVRSAPQYITDEDIEDTILEMADYISQNKKDIRTDKMDWIFHNIACRAAVKAGNKSTVPELKNLALKLLKDDSLRYCPHGRPVCIVFKKSEIEKQFGRM
ncbi:MAG: DNA mismatch repair endonuclease MutL [Ruminococcaceae bacterium]|nr:DNA mismatch repair endonuclease MutL [Oscillospiraceae bacterium]